jgi:pRiA4b ORF-3-like protein
VAERQAYVFEAELADHPGVSRTFALAGDQTLELLHVLLRGGFGWGEDHLYSFWLDGEFWGDPESEYTAPFEPEEVAKTVDVALDALGLEPGQRIAYIFDFGDEWRVDLRVADIRPAADEKLPSLLASRGEAPPQYPDDDEDEEP